MTRRLGFALLLFLSLGVTAYAVGAYAFLPLGALLHPDMRASFLTHPGLVHAHVFGASCALALGPFQFVSRLRAGRPALHRALGRLYLGAGVLLGGLSGLLLAFDAFGGAPARLGFGALAVAWLFTGARAYAAIRARDTVTHRRWMVRNFALTFAAVMLRVYLPLAMVSGIAFEAAYPVIAWLCWVPNLVVAEARFARRAA